MRSTFTSCERWLSINSPGKSVITQVSIAGNGEKGQHNIKVCAGEGSTLSSEASPTQYWSVAVWRACQKRQFDGAFVCTEVNM